MVAQEVQVHGLHHVFIEASLSRVGAVFVASVTAHPDDEGAG
jgi:hypothetical protein